MQSHFFDFRTDINFGPTFHTGSVSIQVSDVFYSTQLDMECQVESRQRIHRCTVVYMGFSTSCICCWPAGDPGIVFMRPCQIRSVRHQRNVMPTTRTYEFLKHALVECTLRLAACVILLYNAAGQTGCLEKRWGYTPGCSAPGSSNALQTAPNSLLASC